MASAVKLVCSETAGRVIDKAVQIFGGRGYMRDSPSSASTGSCASIASGRARREIQRVVIGNELRKRGAELYTGWPVEGA